MNQLWIRPERRHRHGQDGFTLIELLVVIAVLAILAAIVIFNVTGVTNRGSSSACSTDVKTLQVAVDASTSDNGGSLPAFLTSSTGGVDMTNAAANGGTSDNDQLVNKGYLHASPSTTECKGAQFTLTTTNPVVNGATLNVYTVSGS